ncbi:hypothetical protein [Pseudomonas putida]|uniref:hypothetical protein n=1 Tax=Pseudomonas putida TaxID=303 RepID=UPI003905FB3D
MKDRDNQTLGQAGGLGSELTHHRLQDSRADQDEIHPHSNVEQPGSWRTGQGQRNRAIPVQVLLSTYAKWLNSANDWAELAKLERNVMGTELVQD